MIKISASTHPAKDEYLSYVKQVEKAGVDMIHCDVMDGEFVKDKAFSSKAVADINSVSTIYLDVHLMVKKVTNKLKKYKKAGANGITVHYEAFKSDKKLIRVLKKINKWGLVSGVSIKPDTKVDKLIPLLDYIDLVLVMSVEPGKSGQEFIPSSIEKIKTLKKLIENKDILIEVDGGINLNTKQAVIDAGADILVVGSALYNEKEKGLFIQKLKTKKEL